MKRIVWMDSAKRDLKQIRSYIGQDSRENANRFIQKIRQAVAGMNRFPEAGSLVPEFDSEEIREIFAGSYRVAYRIAERTIQILAVTHGARILPDSLGQIE